MASAIEIDTLQGTLGDSIWFHLDLSTDVLYVRSQATRNEPAFGEETPEGFTLLRTDSGDFAGITVVNYWEHFGSGDLAHTSIHAVKKQVAAWAKSQALVA